MNNQRDPHHGKRGAALFTVIMLVMAVSAMLAYTIRASVQQVYSARKLSERIKALAIAEAGANYAYHVLATNFAARTSDDEFPLTVYAGGSYDCTVTPISNTVAVIRSDGVYGSATETVILDIKNYGSSYTWNLPEEAFDYGILCGGTFDFRGCGNISSTSGAVRIHANSILDVRGNAGTDVSIESSTKIKIGNNITISGDVTAPTLQYKASKVTITGSASQTSVPYVEIPDIDLTPYYNWANDNGEVHNGFTVSGGTYDANGGVIWVNGDVHVSGHSTINGSIIATGDIHISGQSDVNASEYGFAIATRDGDITYTSTGTTDGLVYARTGDYTQTANGNVEGQIIIKGNIRKGGNSDVLLFEKTVPTPPDDDSLSGDLIGLSAWQK